MHWKSVEYIRPHNEGPVQYSIRYIFFVFFYCSAFWAHFSPRSFRVTINTHTRSSNSRTLAHTTSSRDTTRKRKRKVVSFVCIKSEQQKMLPYFVVRSSSDSGNGGIQHYAELRTEQCEHKSTQRSRNLLFYIFPSIYILDIIFIFALVCPAVERQLASTPYRLSVRKAHVLHFLLFFPRFPSMWRLSRVCECVEHDESVNFRKILSKNVTGFQQLPAAGPNNERQHQRTCDLITLPMQCVYCRGVRCCRAWTSSSVPKL